MQGLDRRQTAIMMAQFKKAIAAPNEFIKFSLKTDSVNEWYILLSGFEGNDSEYTYTENGEMKFGEYLCRMVAPADFPFNPPEFYMLTENGLYGIEEKVCISIGEFHAKDYRAALGMAGFAEQLVSGLIGWKELGNGIRIIKTTAGKKSKLAKYSREYNYNVHPDIMNAINSSYAEYSSKWDLTKIPAPMREKLGL